MCARGGSNARPPASDAGALSAELRARGAPTRTRTWSRRIRNPVRYPLRHEGMSSRVPTRRAGDRVRTGDLHLGKVTRYQLRYVRVRR